MLELYFKVMLLVSFLLLEDGASVAHRRTAPQTHSAADARALTLARSLLQRLRRA